MAIIVAGAIAAAGAITAAAISAYESGEAREDAANMTASARAEQARQQAWTMRDMSANRLQEASARFDFMRLALQKETQNTVLQTRMNITEAISGFSTRLQIAVENARISLRNEDNTHVENIMAMRNQALRNQVQRDQDQGVDLHAMFA